MLSCVRLMQGKTFPPESELRLHVSPSVISNDKEKNVKDFNFAICEKKILRNDKKERSTAKK
jgi:hypothetical protein